MAEQLIKHDRAVIVAPAGCGKTEIIVDAVGLCEVGKQLVLTHTNAGVDSLSKRFKRKGVPNSKYKLQTIASFAAEYAHAFPRTSNAPLKENNMQYYDKVYDSAAKILNTLFGKSIVRASYAGVFVDEYQDCNMRQHEIVKLLAEVLPCRVLGDPMQGIFDFGGNEIVDWDRDVYTYFESLGDLKDPWRWKQASPELGQWIMQTRMKLENNEPIEFTQLPDSVIWMINDNNNDNQRNNCFAAKRKGIGTCVAIHKLSHKAHALARQLGGQFYSDEEVEGKDLISICKLFGVADSQNIAIQMCKFAASCCTGLQGLRTILKKIENKDYNMNRISTYREIANILVNIAETGSYKSCYEFLCTIEKCNGFKIFRKELWCEFKRVLRHCINSEGSSPIDVAIAFRSISSLSKRYDYENIVSRILLIKGLEYDQAIVLDAGELTKKEFHVAISRPKHRLVILSKNRTILFK
ncbi:MULTISPECIES: UvrD-helicase domain-containing protein [Pelosinus]|nr:MULTISPECIES: UvrD-helicase domain-containing protein [Pelosinus]